MSVAEKKQNSLSESLTDKVLTFQRSGSGLDDLLGLIAPMVYGFPRRERSADEDDCGNFYCFFMPKVPSLIRRFSFQGRAFEVYLASCLRWQFRSYAKQKINMNRSANTARDDMFWPAPYSAEDSSMVAEAPSRPTVRAQKILGVGESGTISDPIIARRLLLLALKASQELDEVTISRIVKLTGVSEAWFRDKICDLHSRLDDRRKRRMMLRRRRDQAFFRLKLFEARLKNEINRRELLRLEKLINQERMHLKNARHELARVPVSPTHRDIGEVLDMPKGSVDSALYYMRTSLKDFNETDLGKSISPN